MILNAITKWNGRVAVDGVEYASLDEAKKSISKVTHDVQLLLNFPKQSDNHIVAADGETEWRISVRKYMTLPSSPEFDFADRWNNGVPMPLRTMVGKVVKETKGMVYMQLHGDITSRLTQACMKCGRVITNPVSQYFGMGPECGGHNYVHPFASDAELEAAVNKYRTEVLNNIRWEGWIIKSAILEKEPINNLKGETQ